MKNRKQKELYSREFKLKYMGYGDWLDEPDLVEFEYKGIKCLVVRFVIREPYARVEAYFGGHLCGYIFLPQFHPLYGKECEKLDLICWGGVTYAELTEDGWMVGFDCGHLTDLIPTIAHNKNKDPILEDIKKMYGKLNLLNANYKSMDFCIKQCKSMAKQVSKMTSKL